MRNIAIELHSADCERAFFEAMSDYRYTASRSGELTLCLDISPKP